MFVNVVILLNLIRVVVDRKIVPKVFATSIITKAENKMDGIITRSSEFHNKMTFFHENVYDDLENRLSKLREAGLFVPHQTWLQSHKTRVIALNKVLVLIEKFLNFKKQRGSAAEKEVLSQYENYADYCNRLFTCRPVVFYMENDIYLLNDGTEGSGGFEHLSESGRSPDGKLSLQKLISYDEMQLSALLSVSVPTIFINSGSRYNSGIINRDFNHQQYGIYVASVGARFEVPGKMEWAHMMVTREQNIIENGYGTGATQGNAKTELLRLWAEFYLGDSKYFPSFDEVEHLRNTNEAEFKSHYIDCSSRNHGNRYLNKIVYGMRMRMVVEPFLLEANERAKDMNMKAYVHAVGLGLGVWMISSEQTQILVDVYRYPNFHSFIYSYIILLYIFYFIHISYYYTYIYC